MSSPNSSKSPKVAIHTHGCKLNQADSQVLARQFQQAGFTVVRSAAQADVVVLNSCTVTANSDSKARQYLRRARRNNPNAMVVATGCYAQRAKDDLLAMDAVTLVLDNRDKPNLVYTIATKLNVVVDSSVQIALAVPEGRSRAMIKIQEGCDQVCAYCIVPKVRGRERSIPPEEIIAEINGRADTGCREAVLTGTQLGTYGFDFPGIDLPELLRTVLAETSIDRLRVSSLQAQEIS
jgi:threonylcarbamoyladenosine tRNA methylthiotransferase MtaB